MRGSQWITTKATLLPGGVEGDEVAPGVWHLALVFRLLSSGRPLRPGTCAWLGGASVAGAPAAGVVMGFPPLGRAGAPAPETGQLAVSMTYLFLLVFHVTFLKKQTEQL